MRGPLEFVRRQCAARPLAAFSACFLLGAMINEWLRLPLFALVCAAALAVGALIAFRRARGCFALLIAAGMLLGSARMALALSINPAVSEKFSVEFEGKVVSDPIYDSEKERIICTLRLTTLDGEPQTCRVRLYLRSETLPLEGVEYGQRLTCFGHVWPQEHATNPHQFDVQNWLMSDGMTGMAAAKLEQTHIEPASFGLGNAMIALRRSISNQIERLFPRNTELVRAFVLGDRSGLDDDLNDSFRSTGVMHLICISGLHISVLASAVSMLLGRLLKRRTAVFVTLMLVMFYGFLVGFPASLIRAAVMFALFSFAPLTGRYSDSITRLSAALLAMLAANPLYLYDGGFALSFAASAGIILIEPPISALTRVDRLKHLKPLPNRLLNAARGTVLYFPKLACATFAAQLATLPLVIGMFGAQPLIGIAMNLIAVPLAMIAYPLALGALVLSAIWPFAGAFAARLADNLFSLLVALVQLCASLPMGELRAPKYPVWLTGVHWILTLAMSPLSRLSERFRRILPISLALLACVSMLCARVLLQPFQVVFMDAGQADAAVIHAQGKTWIIDAGDDYSPVCDYVTAASLGVDAVFLSHPHRDHAAGLEELLDQRPPKIIYVPKGWFDVEADESVQKAIEHAQSLEIPIVELSAGDVVALTDDVCATVYNPSDITDDVNDMSLVLNVEYRSASVLFTGDLSENARTLELPNADILKVPHHGSAKACGRRFIQAVSPEISVISVGENRYGHPSDETIQRLVRAGSAVYRTDQCGAISFRLRRDGSWQIKTYLPMEAYS